MAGYKLLYFPVLVTCCLVTVGYWIPPLLGDGRAPNAKN